MSRQQSVTFHPHNLHSFSPHQRTPHPHYPPSPLHQQYQQSPCGIPGQPLFPHLAQQTRYSTPGQPAPLYQHPGYGQTGVNGGQTPAGRGFGQGERFQPPQVLQNRPVNVHDRGGVPGHVSLGSFPRFPNGTGFSSPLAPQGVSSANQIPPVANVTSVPALYAPAKPSGSDAGLLHNGSGPGHPVFMADSNLGQAVGGCRGAGPSSAAWSRQAQDVHGTRHLQQQQQQQQQNQHFQSQSNGHASGQLQQQWQNHQYQKNGYHMEQIQHHQQQLLQQHRHQQQQQQPQQQQTTLCQNATSKQHQQSFQLQQQQQYQHGQRQFASKNQAHPHQHQQPQPQPPPPPTPTPLQQQQIQPDTTRQSLWDMSHCGPQDTAGKQRGVGRTSLGAGSRSPEEVAGSRSRECMRGLVSERSNKEAVADPKHRVGDDSAWQQDGQQERNTITEEMLQSTLQRFPDLRHEKYCVPPIRGNKTKYRRLKQLSTNKQDVMEQPEMQSASLLGDQTEDTISRLVTDVVESVEGPMFILSNYQFDDYMFYLDRRHKHSAKCSSQPAKDPSHTAKDPSHTAKDPSHTAKDPSHTAKDPSHTAKDPSHTVKDPSHTAKDPSHTAKDPSHTSKDPSNTGSRSSPNPQRVPSPSVINTSGRKNSNRCSESSTDSDCALLSPTETNLARMDTHCSVDTTPHTLEALRHCSVTETERSSSESDGTPKPSWPCWNDVTVCNDVFPTPKDLEKTFRRGDFDCLIISPQYGFIVIEAKTMRGCNGAGTQAKATDAEGEDMKDDTDNQDIRSGIPPRDGGLYVPDNSQTVDEGNVGASRAPDAGFQSESLQLTPEAESQRPFSRNNEDSQLQCRKRNFSREEVSSLHIGHDSQFEAMSWTHTTEDNIDEASNTHDQPLAQESQVNILPAAVSMAARSQENTGSDCLTMTTRSHVSSESESVSMTTRSHDNSESESVSMATRSHVNSESESVSMTTGSHDSSESGSVGCATTADNDEDFRKTITKSLNQLRKAEKVLRHLTSDLTSFPVITKVLALPNTSSAELRHLLEDTTLREECCQVLETSTPEEVLSRCITADLVTYLHTCRHQADVTKPGATNTQSSSPLLQWWRAVVGSVARRGRECEGRGEGEEDGGDVEIPLEAYEQIVSRFCGSYSRLATRTVSECVHLTGVEFGRYILRHEQLLLLSCPSPFLYITGPPGAGKTLVLALKAAEWAKAGDQVVVVCFSGVNYGSLISWTLYDRVAQALDDFIQEEIRKNQSSEDPEGPEKKKSSRRERYKRNKSRRPSTKAQAGGENDVADDLKAFPDDEEMVDEAQFLKSRVQKMEIGPKDDVDKFVTDLLHKHRDRNLRVIVDECQRYVSKEKVFENISKAQRDFDKMKDMYQNMIQELSGRSVKLVPREDCEGVVQSSRKKENRNSKTYLVKSSLPGRHGLNSASVKKEKSRELSSHSERKNPASSNSTEGNARAAQSRERTFAKDSTTTSTSAPERANRVVDYFSTMQERMRLLDNRFQTLQPSGPGGPGIYHAPQWKDGLRVLRERFDQVRILVNEAEALAVPSAVSVDIDDSLEELARLVVAVMGFLYHAYMSLTFFQVDHFYAAIRRAVEERRTSSGAGSGDVSVWSASVFCQYSPAGYRREMLTQSIRCPPTVQRILKWTEGDIQKPPNYDYVTRGCDVNPPLPSDGPPVTWFDHAPHMTSCSEINDCAQCGKNLADYLISTLGLQQFVLKRPRGKGRKPQEQKNQLYFHDVIISGSPIHQQTCAFIQEVERRKIGVQYEVQELKSPPPYCNKVFVVGGANVQGVEAKIVVYVPEIKRITEEERRAPSASAAGAAHPGQGQGQGQGGMTTPGSGQGRYKTQSTGTDSPEGMQCGSRDAASANPRKHKGTRVTDDVQKDEDRGTPADRSARDDAQLATSSTHAGVRDPGEETRGEEKQLESVCRCFDLDGDGAEKYSRRDLEEMDILRRLGTWNRDYLWHVASRSVSHLIVFHV